MVYAVPSSFIPRKNSLIVSAGARGGGGLDVYGALQCGKIYSVFLQMPGKAWTLQYCHSPNSSEAPMQAGASAVVRLEHFLTPPDAEARFDFGRLPVPQELKSAMVILKGTIKADGTVSQLQVYQGILSEIDEAARLAFSQWKFRPATQEGKPVAVDILIGIPAEVPITNGPN
jgi:hypothetical protein